METLKEEALDILINNCPLGGTAPLGEELINLWKGIKMRIIEKISSSDTLITWKRTKDQNPKINNWEKWDKLIFINGDEIIFAEDKDLLNSFLKDLKIPQKINLNLSIKKLKLYGYDNPLITRIYQNNFIGKGYVLDRTMYRIILNQWGMDYMYDQFTLKEAKGNLY